MTSLAPISEAGQAVIERHCPQCRGGGFAKMEAYSKDGWPVGECTGCGFVYLRIVPVYERIAEEFAWEKSKPAESERRRNERPFTSRLSMAFRRLRKPFRSSEQTLFEELFADGPVLDVGCGNGERIPDRFTPFGIELSPALHANASAQMQPRGGDCVHAPAVEGIRTFEPRFFTGIILRSFLEHEWQPRELLAGARRVLRDDGKIFVRVPNYGSLNRRIRGHRWCGFRWPDHVNYFTADSLRAMAADCGFAMRLLNPMKISIDDNIKAVLTPIHPKPGPHDGDMN